MAARAPGARPATTCPAASARFRASTFSRQSTCNSTFRCKAANSDADASRPDRRRVPGIGHSIRELFRPFQDRRANARFLALALGGMLCSVATMIHDSYLPVFMKNELGLTNTRIGSVQALSQLLSQVSKSFSGVMGDVLGSQSKILVFGMLLTAACKPMFASSLLVYSAFGAGACLWVITLGKLLDRVSKGFREAPTKALLSQTARDAGESADAAFSVRQSLATIGSLVGSAVASGVFIASRQSYVTTFAAAAVPPVIALAWLLYVFRDELRAGRHSKAPSLMPESKRQSTNSPGESSAPTSLFQKAKLLICAFKPAYWQAVAVVSVLYFGRFDFAWVTLRAQTCQVPRSLLPLLGSATMLATTSAALATGRFAKGRGVRARNGVLAAGMGMLITANALLAAPLTANVPGMVAACVCIGVHMGMTHGLSLSMLSSYMPQGKVPGLGMVSGTAWSFTDMMLGVILASSNQLAGKLTDMTVAQSMGNVGCFWGGGIAALAATALLLVFSKFGHLGAPLEAQGR